MKPVNLGNISKNTPKPKTPASIKMASETAHTRHNRGTNCFIRPALRIKAFCGPIASISDKPRRNPDKKFSKKLLPYYEALLMQCRLKLHFLQSQHNLIRCLKVCCHPLHIIVILKGVHQFQKFLHRV